MPEAARNAAETGAQGAALIMEHPLLEDFLKQTPSAYKLVITAARRAMELNNGAPKLVHTDAVKVSTIALDEIRQGKVTYEAAEAAGKKAEKSAKKAHKKEA